MPSKRSGRGNIPSLLTGPGGERLAAAQAIQDRFDIPAIAATGHLTAAEAEAAGLLGILSKPYTSHALRGVLEEAAAWLKSGSSRPFLRR